MSARERLAAVVKAVRSFQRACAILKLHEALYAARGTYPGAVESPYRRDKALKSVEKAKARLDAIVENEPRPVRRIRAVPS